MTVRSAWHLSTGQTPEDTRVTTSGLLTPTGALSSRGGVVPGGLEIRGVSGMQCEIGPGRAIIQGTDKQGPYMVAVTEPEILTMTAGNPTHARIDRIVLMVEDSPYDNSGRTQAVVRVVEGQASAAPVEPPMPATALPLYSVRVHAGASGASPINWNTAVMHRRYPTTALGGIVPTHGFDGIYTGQYRDNGSRLERWDGTKWAAYPPVPTWKSWTPTWGSAAATPPLFGNSTIECRYVQTGLMVHFQFRVLFGSTTNFRTGGDNWRFTLPVPAASGNHCIGFVELHNSTNERAVARIRCSTPTYFELEVSSGKPSAGAIPAANTGIVDAISPWTWAPNHMINGSGTYEAASA
ncbi:hypothetical protein [Streptomyces sp. CAU 1734]|uniref:hypothetical protein n=1 Tax=Streptomyces sp. CAU 1734 TaxID=3140360 RepID=UPI0032616CC1